MSSTAANLIRVNRTHKPEYPPNIRRILHSELELSGPTEYDLTQIELWRHRGQEGTNVIVGTAIYDHLELTNSLRYHFTLLDLITVKEKGATYFRTHFAGYVIFAWASTAEDHTLRKFTPYLCEQGDGIILDWIELVYSFPKNFIGIRHKILHGT